MGRTACTEPQCLHKGDLYLYLTCISDAWHTNAHITEYEVWTYFILNVDTLSFVKRRLTTQTVFDENYEHAKVEGLKLPYISQEGVRQIRGIAPLIHGNRCRWVVNFTTLPHFSRERTPVPRGAPETVWAFRRR